MYYDEVILSLEELRPGVNLDPASGPHNRTTCGEAFYRFDQNSAKWSFHNSALVGKHNMPSAPSDAWVQMTTPEQAEARVNGLKEWDQYVGLPLGVLWDSDWDLVLESHGIDLLPQVVLSIGNQMLEEWEKATSMPSFPAYSSLKESEKGRFPTEFDWVRHHYLGAARSLASSPFTVQDILESPETEWLFGDEKIGFAAKMSFVAIRENGHGQNPRYFAKWREMLVFDRLPFTLRRDVQTEDWRWKTVLCGDRDDGSPVWLQDEESGVLDLVKEWRQDGVNIIALSAPKGMGKTNFTKRLRDDMTREVKEQSGNEEAECVFRALFHRVSLVKDASNRYEVSDYQTLDNLQGASSVCSTYHSLHKLSHREVIAAKRAGGVFLLSLDEILSGFLTIFGPEDIDSDGIKNLGSIYDNLARNIGLADLVVVSDADIHPAVVDIVYMMRRECAKKFGDQIPITPPKVGWITVADRRPKADVELQTFTSREEPLPVYLSMLLNQGKTFLVLGDTRGSIEDAWEHCCLYAKGSGGCPDPYPDRFTGPIGELGLEEDPGFKSRFLLLTGNTRSRSECSAFLGDVNTYVSVRQPQGVFASPVLESGVSYEGSHFDEVIVVVRSLHSTAQSSSQQSGRSRKTSTVKWMVLEGSRRRTQSLCWQEELHSILNAQSLQLTLAEYEETVSNDSRWSTKHNTDLLRHYSDLSYNFIEDRYNVCDKFIGPVAFGVAWASTHLSRQTRDRLAAIREQLMWECQGYRYTEIVSSEEAAEQKVKDQARLNELHSEILSLARSATGELMPPERARERRVEYLSGKIAREEIPQVLSELLRFSVACQGRNLDEVSEWDVGRLMTKDYEDDLEWRALVLESVGEASHQGSIRQTLINLGHNLTEAGYRKAAKVRKVGRVAKYSPALRLLHSQNFHVRATPEFVQACLEIDSEEIASIMKRFKHGTNYPPHKMAGYLLGVIWGINAEYITDRGKKKRDLLPYPIFEPCSTWIEPRGVGG